MTTIHAPAWELNRSLGPVQGPLHCGHTFDRDAAPFTDGSAILDDGSRICYDCATAADRSAMRDATPGDRFTAYVSSDGRTLTSWPGRELGTVVGWGERHPWSNSRRYVSVRDVNGGRWRGTAEPGMWASLRRCAD